ncbi:sensor histidine kinase [Fibrella sp. WM1]|uniref:sensor histidine kinase n=1 Tax=Fibrella musci TaxID=3242485 RepID=UPI0035224AB8
MNQIPLSERLFFFTQRYGRMVLYHLLAWLAYGFYEGVLIVNVVLERSLSVPYLLAYYITFSIPFYINALWLLPRFFQNRAYASYAIGLVLTICGTLLIKYWWQYSLFPAVNWSVSHISETTQKFVVLNLFYIVEFLIYSFVYWFATGVTRLEREKAKLQSELLNSKLEYLRLQINPHFLFNTLNFFYSKALPVSQPLANGVILLSDMMRYALSEDQPDRKVPLHLEVQHVENFIQMQRLRFGDKLQIDYRLIGNPGTLRILPLILITFIENVFKHGELHDANNPAQIYLFVHADHVQLHIHNLHKAGMKEHSSGIGVENCRKRLYMVYRNRADLVVSNAADHYNLSLTIQLTS